MKTPFSPTAPAAPRRPLSLLLPALLAAAALVAGCSEPTLVAKALEIGQDTVCALDGMRLLDFPGPKGQIQYDQGAPEFFCDTKELFSAVLRPETKQRIAAIFTQDMAKADWASPQGHWIDARHAFYVVGSRMPGSMGPTIASFAAASDAQTFAGRYGGQVLAFDQVTPDMVDLSGGVLHDKKM